MQPARMLPAERRAWVLRQLRERGTLRVATLARQLGVSAMTVHRDLDELVRLGHARKVRGGAVVAEAAPAVAAVAGRCGICGKPTDGWHAFVVHPDQGPPGSACCAHCGLLLLQARPGTALAVDFLLGHTISAVSAYYLAGPDLVVCCQPALLPFGSRQHAQRFQQGFGGRLLSLTEAIEWVRSESAPRHVGDSREEA